MARGAASLGAPGRFCAAIKAARKPELYQRHKADRRCGFLIGTFLGACLIPVLADGLALVGIGDLARQMTTGAVIVPAVVADSYPANMAERAAIIASAEHR